MEINQPRLRVVSGGAQRDMFVSVARTAFVGAVLIGSAIYGCILLSASCEDVVLEPPNNITATNIWASSSQSRIEWVPSATAKVRTVTYTVRICDAYGPCVANSRLMSCRHRETAHSWLEFESNVDTQYCIVVKATSWCGSNVIESNPSLMELRTPSFAPRDFEVSATATGPTSVQIVAFLPRVLFMPQINDGVLERCYITLGGGEPERTFSCGANRGTTSVTLLTGLRPATDYNLSVTFANVHNDWEMGTRRTVSFTTLGVPVNANSTQEENVNSKRNQDGAMLLLVLGGLIFACCVSGNKVHNHRKQRRNRR